MKRAAEKVREGKMVVSSFSLVHISRNGISKLKKLLFSVSGRRSTI